ncbi:Protein wntless-like [Holothuria leucospilota]|uniref:Protein wntless-like n=1 Tax=Holothuria leucospilota TaxID=206669 RepID=A0A9Q1HBW2_HOLLE|nr:Protein wntless-like [Holothuria leucospilota]
MRMPLTRPATSVSSVLSEGFIKNSDAAFAPKPTNPNKNLATKCIDPTESLLKPFVPWGKGACTRVRDFEEAVQKQIPASSIVFSVRMPHNGFEMSKLFQFMVGVLTLEIEYDENIHMEKPTVYLEETYSTENTTGLINYYLTTVRMKRAIVRGTNMPEPGAQYDCEPLSLFELSSVHHKHYLINIRLPVGEIDLGNGEKKLTNEDIGAIKDVNIVKSLRLVILMSMIGITITAITNKRVFAKYTTFQPFFMIKAPYKKKHGLSVKHASYSRWTIFCLAIVMSFLNFPLEWLTLIFEIPAMLLISDIRQGASYAMLFSFWIIFVGEHMMDQIERNRLGAYWQQILAIGTACCGLLAFDMTERGSQLINPFYSVWNSEQGAKLAMGFIILAGVCVFVYFFSLLFMVFCVFRNLRMKSIAFNSMPKNRKKYYQALVYRFRFFIIFSLFCAVMTIIFFIMSQVSEIYSWHLDDEDGPRIHYTSGFFTGVYGLWNIYVLAVLFLYSPSHKEEPLLSREMMTMPTIEFPLLSFLRHKRSSNAITNISYLQAVTHPQFLLPCEKVLDISSPPHTRSG